jgi:tRNA1Val (adenine37-N6)-methyltransferase
LEQPRRGYRFGVDSVLLAAEAAAEAAGKDILDACAGCGVVSLCISFLAPAPPRSLTAVELQAELCDCAQRNAERNDVALRVLRGDLRSVPLQAESFDLVVANPPFRVAGTGRLAPEPGRALGRHELALSLADLLQSTSQLLRPGGEMVLIHLAEREQEVLKTAVSFGLRPLSLRRVRPMAGREPSSVLFRLRRGAGDGNALREREDLVLHDEDGNDLPEITSLLEQGRLPSV